MSQHQTCRGAVAMCVVGGRMALRRLGPAAVDGLAVGAQHAS